jgi:hypothetical protein
MLVLRKLVHWQFERIVGQHDAEPRVMDPAFVDMLERAIHLIQHARQEHEHSPRPMISLTASLTKAVH